MPARAGPPARAGGFGVDGEGRGMGRSRCGGAGRSPTRGLCVQLGGAARLLLLARRRHGVARGPSGACGRRYPRGYRVDPAADGRRMGGGWAVDGRWSGRWSGRDIGGASGGSRHATRAGDAALERETSSAERARNRRREVDASGSGREVRASSPDELLATLDAMVRTDPARDSEFERACLGPRFLRRPARTRRATAHARRRARARACRAGTASAARRGVRGAGRGAARDRRRRRRCRCLRRAGRPPRRA